MSMPRFVLVVFPALWVLARSRLPEPLVLCFSAGSLVLLGLLFTNWFGCGSRGGTSASPRDRPVGVASLVDPLAFLVEMERPVVVEVSVAASRPELQDRFRPFQAPPGASEIEPVLDQMAACAFDYAGGDRPSLFERAAVVEVVAFGEQVVRAVVGVLPGASIQAQVALRRIAAATVEACPRSTASAFSATHSSAAGSPSAKKDQAEDQMYSRTLTKSQTMCTSTWR